ncbi:MAG: helix-hairpin-helix domain-containing protein [Candidatus Obscuribacterales bacterium]|nr:helix-hairpin-helix domain-containing protein [Candidatus Obscuribacterales bacterium]
MHPDQQRGLIWILSGLFTVLLVGVVRDSWTRDRANFDQIPAHTIDFQLDLNEATRYELVQLPGVGPKLAESIIDFRNTHGRFRSLDDLDQVKGIGSTTLAQLRPYLHVKEVGSSP